MNASQISRPVEMDLGSQPYTVVVSDDPPVEHDPETLRALATNQLSKELLVSYPGLRFLSPDEMSQSYKPPKFLIENTLVEKQPCILGAQYKSMKTTLATSMALSLVTGQNFLGVYRIPVPRRVLLMCGESGHSKVWATVNAWLKANHLSSDSIRDKLWITTEVPNFSEPSTLVAVEAQLDIHEPEVVILDPLYLSLNDEQASIINNGRQLKQLTQPYEDRGITFIGVDHFRVAAREKSNPTLASLCGAGKAAYFRQWILMNRVGKFSGGPQRRHKIDMSVGGSEGHFWQERVEIIEEFEENRLTRLSCTIHVDPDRDTAELSLDESGDHEHKVRDKDRRDKAAIIQLLEDQPIGEIMMKTEIRNRLKLTNSLCTRLLGELLGGGTICKQKDAVARKNGRLYDGYRLLQTMVTSAPQH